MLSLRFTLGTALCGLALYGCGSDSSVRSPAARTGPAGNDSGGASFANGGQALGGASSNVGANAGQSTSSAGSSAGSAGSDGAGRAGGDAGGTSGGNAGAGGSGGATSRTDPRPNIIVVLADDMGFSDIGCYGGEIETPNIDALASEGLRFTNFYNASRCAPSRAALLTGLYPHRVKFGNNNDTDLGLNGLTMAEALGSAGYNTAMIGKWHLSQLRELPDSLLPGAGPGGAQMAWYAHRIDPGLPFVTHVESYPTGRGFQHFYGVVGGPVDYFDPFSLLEDAKAVPSVPADFYMTQAFGDRAVRYVEQFATSDKPFFLYLAQPAPHAPLHALPQDIAKYQSRYLDGWAPVREARYQKQLELGLFDAASAPLPAAQVIADWNTLSAPRRELQIHTMQTHAAQVDRLDQTVGELLAALKRTGQYENTLLVFLSDNGASSELSGASGTGNRSPVTRDGRTIEYCQGPNTDCPFTEPGPETTFATLGASWANVANTPFRYFKVDSFRGGTSTPLIVHWPAGLRTAPGALTPQLGHVIDLLPTFLDVAGVPYPKTFKGNQLTPLDGKSFRQVLEGSAPSERAPLFFFLEGGAALIATDYKLVRQTAANAAWELYDVKQDRTETVDLAASKPKLVSQLSGQWQQWFDSL